MVLVIFFFWILFECKRNSWNPFFLNDIKVSIEPLRIIRNVQDLKFLGKGSKVFGMTILIFTNCWNLVRNYLELCLKSYKSLKKVKQKNKEQEKKAEPAAQQPARPSKQSICLAQARLMSGLMRVFFSLNYAKKYS